MDENRLPEPGGLSPGGDAPGGGGSGDGLNLSNRITGRLDSPRNSILTFVADQQCDVAYRELEIYRRYKCEASEIYRIKTDQYFEVSGDAIKAIQAALATKDLQVMPMSKRQLIYEKVTKNFETLSTCLDRLEEVENDLKVKDIQASVWVLKSLSISVATVVLGMALSEGYYSLQRPLEVAVEDTSHFLMGLVGL